MKAKYSVLNDGYFSQGEDDDMDNNDNSTTPSEEKREKTLSESYAVLPPNFYSLTIQRNSTIHFHHITKFTIYLRQLSMNVFHLLYGEQKKTTKLF